GGMFMSQLKTQFFPQDLQYLSYVDVWLPEDSPVSATNRVAADVEATVRRVADAYAKERHGDRQQPPHQVLKSLTTFVGGGGPRFLVRGGRGAVEADLPRGVEGGDQQPRPNPPGRRAAEGAGLGAPGWGAGRGAARGGPAGGHPGRRAHLGRGHPDAAPPR